MSKLDTILAEIESVVSHPGQAVSKLKKETGKQLVGCLPIYVPEEIIYAGGMLPVGLWGGQTSVVNAGKYLPSFACSIMRAIMELAVNGVYRDLSAVVCPMHCDTLKCIGENWKVAVKEVPCVCLVYPQNRKIEAGVEFLTAEFEHIRSELEAITGRKITDENLNKAIELYNEHRKTMREFTRVAADYPVTITPRIRHMIIKSGYFMDKAHHTQLVKGIISELQAKPAEEFKGPRVVLSGIMAEPDGFLQLFEEYGIAVVGDDLAHESRQFRADVPEGKNPMERLARWWSVMEGCSLAYDPLKKRGQMLIDLVKESRADGMVVCMMKFCEPEEFDYPIFKKELAAAGIPFTYLEIEQQAESVEQLRTRIQGFAEMLSH